VITIFVELVSTKLKNDWFRFKTQFKIGFSEH